MDSCGQKQGILPRDDAPARGRVLGVEPARRDLIATQYIPPLSLDDQWQQIPYPVARAYATAAAVGLQVRFKGEAEPTAFRELSVGQWLTAMALPVGCEARTTGDEIVVWFDHTNTHQTSP